MNTPLSPIIALTESSRWVLSPLLLPLITEDEGQTTTIKIPLLFLAVFYTQRQRRCLKITLSVKTFQQLPQVLRQENCKP